MLSVGRLATYRHQRAGTGIRDWPSQGPTLGKHLLQTTSSWAQAPSAHQRGGWVLRTTGRRALVHRRAGGLCFGATWLCHYYRLPTTEADRDAIPRANLDGVPNEGLTPVAPAFGTPLLPAAVCRLEVGEEVVVRLHGDDPPVLRPDLLESLDIAQPSLDGPRRGAPRVQSVRLRVASVYVCAYRTRGGSPCMYVS